MVHNSLPPTTIRTSSSVAVTTAPMSNNELIERIKAHVRQGQQAKERAHRNTRKCEEHFFAAGKYLLELKESLEPGWKSWEQCLQRAVKMSTGRASELMQLADGRKDLQQLRDEKAQSVARLRARSSSLQSACSEETKKQMHKDKDEDKDALSLTSPAALKSPVPQASDRAKSLAQLPSIDDPQPLISALANSTALARKSAVNAVTSGYHSFQFEGFRDAVADLYQQLSRAGR
jgi:hypothetical protein